MKHNTTKQWQKDKADKVELIEALELAAQGLKKLASLTGDESDGLNWLQAQAALKKAKGEA